jgi:hypothetical protein
LQLKPLGHRIKKCERFLTLPNTEIERIRMQGEKVIKHDWIMFDTVDEAMEFFNDRCDGFVGYHA